jgi:VWFA-related protein
MVGFRAFPAHRKGIMLMKQTSAFIVTLALLLLSVPSACAQSSAAPQSSFNANVEVVLVPTVVTDKSGQHVPGLKASDFALLQDKNKTPHIAFCEEITHASRDASQPTALPPGVFSNISGNTSGNPQRPKNLVVIAIDTINTPFSEQVYARKGIIKYLSESVTPDTLVALLFMAPGGVHMLHDFTTDNATLIAALQRVSKGNGKTAGDLAFPKATALVAIDNEASLLSKFETNGYVHGITGQEINMAHQNAVLDTTAALTQIAQIYSGVPGRKALVWVTSGVPRSIELALSTFTAGSKFGPVHETDTTADFERAIKALNDASFAVYAVDAGGLFGGKGYSGNITPGGSVWNGGSGAARSTAGSSVPLLVHQETFNTMQTISNMTGGRAYLNTNDLSKGIRSAANDSDSYYLLGFYLNSEGITPGWHSLKVSTERKNVSVRSREGFLVSRTPVTSVERTRADLSLALRSPVQFSGLPMMLRWQQQPQTPPAAPLATNTQPVTAPLPNAKKHIAFDLVLASNAIQINEADSRAIHVDIVGVAQDKAGDQAATVRQVINQKLTPESADNVRKNGLLYKGTLDLTPGTYTVHLAVRDSLSGKLGSIIAPLKVE